MDDMENMITLGTQLGYQGTDLQGFVEKQTIKAEKLEAEKHERDERAHRREEERLSREAEAERLSREAEAERLSHEVEMRKMELTLNHELQMNRDRLESERLAAQSSTTPRRGDDLVRAPAMQPFKENTMNIETYLSVYERYAEEARWKSTSLPINLGRLLSGKAADVYARLPLSLAHDYESLKNAQLQCYQLTSDDFRNKFYTSRLMDCETAPQ